MARDAMEIAGRERHKRGRARESNDTRVLPGVDGRSLLARRYRDIASQIVADQGGLSYLTESRLQLIRRFTAAACIAEQIEAKLAKGEEIDVAKHALLCSTMVRVANRIGIDRIARDISTTLSDILRKDRAESMRATQGDEERQDEETAVSMIVEEDVLPGDPTGDGAEAGA